MRVLSVVGARPQFIKAAPVSRQLRRQHQEVLLHTGQHYDHGMSQVFFDDLGIPMPDVNLGIGSATHGRQTGQMLAGIESVLLEKQPDWMLVYGDTNSTLAGALAAAKLHIPVGHVEAGLRSFNRAMPEEINRVLTDHIADLLFCPTETAVSNLAVEGIVAGVHDTGDVMLDAVLHHASVAEERSTILDGLALEPRSYLLATVHRPRNTDRTENLRAILEALSQVGETVIFPVHPRTSKMMHAEELSVSASVRLIEPVGYLDMLQLERNARLILTDSGGVQKEAYFLAVPCVTLRQETEWVETVEAGWNMLVKADKERILESVRGFSAPATHPEVFGDGHAAEKIVHLLETTR